MLIQVKNDMRLGDGGTEVGVFRYIGGSDGEMIDLSDDRKSTGSEGTRDGT